MPSINFKFYKHESNELLQVIEAEAAKKQILIPILGPKTSPSELFNAFSFVINILSIMIEVHGEVDQKVISNNFKSSKISENFKGSQISN
jgi:hypothetical protein